MQEFNIKRILIQFLKRTKLMTFYYFRRFSSQRMEYHSYGDKARGYCKDLFIIYLVKTVGDYNMIYGQIFYASEG